MRAPAMRAPEAMRAKAPRRHRRGAMHRPGASAGRPIAARTR